MAKKTLVALLAAIAMCAGGPAFATHDPDPSRPGEIFGLAIVEGKGLITTSASVYKFNDPVWTACKPLVEALPDPQNQLPAPAVNGRTGVFAPCWGPPVNTDTTFQASGIGNPDPVNANSFCVSTMGPCTSQTTGSITGNIAGGVQLGAYAGSSRGISHGTFSASGTPFGSTSYTYTVAWEQSAGTILPLVGTINSGPGAGATIVGFVSARSTPGGGTSGLPSVTSTPASTTIFAVDGMTVSF